MTIPVGVATFFILPDTPYTTKSKFLTAKECELAIDRVTKAGKAAPAGVTLATFKRVLLKWRWYAFVLGYVVSVLFHNPKFILEAYSTSSAVWRVLSVRRLFRYLAQIRKLLGR